MALKRLTPTVSDLGFLRLWRDDLIRIAIMVEQLKDVKIAVTADQNEVGDIDADLPEIGKKLGYFALTATRIGDTSSSAEEVMSLRFSRDSCRVTANNPDPETRGVISDISTLAAQNRRVPSWLPVLMSGQPAPGAAAAPGKGRLRDLLWSLLLVSSLFSDVINGIAIGGYVSNPKHHQIWPVSTALFIGIPVFILGIVIIICEIRSRTLLFTGTRGDAPTFVQRRGVDIIIAVAIAAVFYLLGLVTGG